MSSALPQRFYKNIQIHAVHQLIDHLYNDWCIHFILTQPAFSVSGFRDLTQQFVACEPYLRWQICLAVTNYMFLFSNEYEGLFLFAGAS